MVLEPVACKVRRIDPEEAVRIVSEVPAGGKGGSFAPESVQEVEDFLD